MLVSNSWCEEIAEEILYEVEQLLCNNDIKINNINPAENEFEREDSYINKKDYNELKEKILDELVELVDYTEYRIQDATY